jgi:energy-coupling factor transport system permease protein
MSEPRMTNAPDTQTSDQPTQTPRTTRPTDLPQPGQQRGTPSVAVVATRPLMHWRSVDLITAATIGVAVGVVFRLWGALMPVIETATKGFPPAVGLSGGVWFLAATLAALIIRRPGAALLAELLAATVEMLLAGQYGTGTLVSGVLQGLGVELVFAVFLFRRFGLVQAVLAGISAAVVESLAYEFWFYWADWSMGWRWIYLGFFALSGAVVSGALMWLLVKSLAVTGVLNAFPPGVEHHQQRAV